MKTELITIDDNAIKFEVVKEGGKVKIENKIKVNNISDEKIVLGIKINHREFYVVTPSHCFIEPHEIKEISNSYLKQLQKKNSVWKGKTVRL